MASNTTTISNDYGNEVALWKTDLILSRARRLGFCADELPEVQQDLVPTVAAFVFDPAKANGASERTALTSIIDHLLIKHLRQRGRQQQLLATMAEKALIEEAARPDLDEATDITRWDRQHDLATCISRLPADEQVICQALANGESLARISRRLGLTWSATQRSIERIRTAFTVFGLDAWMKTA
jgi:DNA-directed RNA polymerase specialized sigma24 family protein